MNKNLIRAAVQQGALLNQYWTDNPLFSLPDYGITLMVGKETTIYADNLVNLPINNNMQVNYTCEIGAQVGNNFVVTPIDENIGDYDLTIVFKNGTREYLTKTITLTVYGAAPDVAPKVLMIGDSLMFIGASCIAYGINETLAQTVSYLGTKIKSDAGAPYPTVNHEGLNGASWNTFANLSTTPFFKNGVLDIPAYFADNSIATPDYVLIRLGVNDAFFYCDNTNALFDMPEAAVNTVKADAKKFIDAFLAFDANLKVIIGLPTISENTGFGWDSNYDETRYIHDIYIQNVHKIHVALTETYANGVYNNRVDCSFETIHVNRDDDYPKTLGVHNNGLHMTNPGYDKLGQHIALTLNKFFAEDILKDGLTAANYDYTKNLTLATDKVSVWGDTFGVNDLPALDIPRRPTLAADGVAFYGSYMRKSFTLIQPTVIYLVVKVNTWQVGTIIFEGYDTSSRLIQLISTPIHYINAGSNAAPNDTLTIGKFAIIRVTFNGANSKIQINNIAVTTGNAGANNMNGLSLGAGQDFSGIPVNGVFKRIIVRSSSGNETAINNLLRAKYNSKDF